jgi:hypothetical protein
LGVLLYVALVLQRLLLALTVQQLRDGEELQAQIALVLLAGLPGYGELRASYRAGDVSPAA